MSSPGFGRNSGPGTGAAVPNSQTSFGYLPPSQSSPPSPPWSIGASSKFSDHRSPEISPFNASHNPGTGFIGNFQAHDLRRTRSPPFLSTNGEQLQNSGTIMWRSIDPSRKFEDHQGPAIPPIIPLRNAGTAFPANAQVQDLKRTRSPPPILSPDKNVLQNTRTVPGSHSVLQRSKSPPLFYQTNHSAQGFAPSRETQRHPLHSAPWGNQSNISNNVSYLPAQQDMPLISAYSGDDFGRDTTSKHADVQVHKRTRSPPTPFASQLSIDNMQVPNGSKRPSVSPPRSGMRMNPHADPRSHPWSPPPANANNTGVAGTRSSDVPVPKRSRFPFPPSTDPVFQGNNSSGNDDTEQELQAKAKRLARFKEELSQPEPSDPGNRNQNNQSVMNKRKVIGEASEMAGVLHNNNLSSECEDRDSSTVIIGYCPDMCPEQERAERERKGDLDQYERFEGDRNQTSESLAVKKYTRTAEREAALIRPMPILRKTMDYLLNLLDQPYDDRFLGLYNFLWDRMRAIRMDLRMQHIFNVGAITMLEQMIRLHIIAMHELCQYTKGEGFSEGFDAHLNIEQMNKTSVELFQLYDDHRKKGIDVPTEKEFRGYYALLKLDKHPGYKVEPAELSLDLAKMTPEIRQAAEVLFARDVARACRTGNFIAFFRLARKASYLQACLMHAHFGKLRTQALASLHSGLQNNQGIPIIQLAKWLGMEEENIEDLVEYHGFILKEFEEPYMVKEGPFLNGDSEYPLKRSRLVHLKKSPTVVEDVSSSSLMEPLPPEDPKGLKVAKAFVQEVSPVISKESQSQRPLKTTDNDMDGYEAVSLPMSNTDRWSEKQHPVEVVRPLPVNIFKANTSVGSPKVITTSVGKQRYDTRIRNSIEKHDQSNVYGGPISPRKSLIEPLPDLPIDSFIEDSMVRPVFVENLEPEEPTSMLQEVGNNEVDTTYIDEEVAKAKLKLILRLWRRRSVFKKDLREQKQLAANSALSSLSLGPPMWHYKKQPRPSGDFNIDRAMRKRYEKQEQSWSILNVSDVVAVKLGERNHYPKCICWKLLFCPPDNLEENKKLSHLDPGQWLRSKLIPANVDNNNDLAASSPGLSIWKKWDYGKSTSDKICCLSVVKDLHFDNLVEDTIAGACAIVLLISETLSFEAQKVRLHNLLSSIPSGSCLPLLILTGSHGNKSDPSTIVTNLGLYEVDKSKICSFSVVSLVKNDKMKHTDGFFSDEHLRKGLEWLASESPLQPVVQSVKTRELVHTHLNFGAFEDFEASPEHYISAINEAVDKSIKEIRNSANSNSISWPCPEISLLSEFSNERKIIDAYLPNTGWSNSTQIEPLIRTLYNCKLPNVPKDLSLGIDIENQKLQFEDFLVNYLTPLMGSHLAQKESSIMLQNCVGLELHGSSYRIVPKWLMIFRRLFNWQLTSLSNGPFATAHILEQKQHHQQSEEFFYESYTLISPSLDEMIEVCCSSNLNHRDFQPLKDQMVINGDDLMQEEKSFLQNGEEPEVHDDDGVMNEPIKTAMETDRLSKLLEHCNIVQNMIDKKLSIYF